MSLSISFSDYKWPMKNPEHRPFSHQRDTMSFLLCNKRAFVLNDLGCVDSETEFLSRKGWVRIADWNGEDVAQWSSTSKRASFVSPTSFIKKPCNEFIAFGEQMVLSPEHRVVGLFNGKLDVRSALDVHTGEKPLILRSFLAPDNVDGLPYSDIELRIMVAYIADGTIIARNGYKEVAVRVKLADKIQRMRDLLEASGIEYREQTYNSGRTSFIFKPILAVKEYTDIFYSASEHQLKIICDEVWRWDGRKVVGRHNRWEFSTMIKASADFIQYAFSALNYPTSLLKSTKTYKYVAKNPRTRLSGESTTMYIVSASMLNGKAYKPDPSSFVEASDGYKYCFEVPETFWIMRRGDVITVTGNTGKTLSALWACDFLMLNKKIKRVLIATPLSTMRAVWANEIFFNFNGRKFVIAHGTRGERAAAIKSNAEFVIINHDGLVTMQSELMAAKFDVFIIDELTAFKNHKTNRWASAKAIGDACKAFWGMTAEPTPNTPVEAYAQAKLINDKNPFLPRLFTQYRDMVEDKLTPHISIPTEQAKGIVHRVLQPSIRFERDKCVDLPPCQYIDLEIAMTPAQKDAYERMRKELIIEYNEGLITAANAAVKAMKLAQVAAGWVKDDEGNVHEIDSSIRLEELMTIFENTHKGKLIVFVAFRAAVEGVCKYFKSKKIKAEYIHGGVSPNRRGDLIADFQNGSLQVLVIQPQSTSHGVTLTAASTIVWHSLVPSGEVHNQANGRISRIGQTRKQTVIYMIGCQAEKRIRSILKNKGNMSQETLALFAEPSE